MEGPVIGNGKAESRSSNSQQPTQKERGTCLQRKGPDRIPDEQPSKEQDSIPVFHPTANPNPTHNPS